MSPESALHFQSLGIDVEFNTLGSSAALRNSFIGETWDEVNATEEKRSQPYKGQLYNKFYPIAARRKLTGFESFPEQQNDFKSKSCSLIRSNSLTPCEIVPGHANVGSYLSTLTDTLNGYSKPVILYFSGGIDSELLAKHMLTIGKAFTPVIFKWTDSTGSVQNDNETQYAFTFCAINNLTPIVKTVDIDSLWASKELLDLAVNMGVISPQLATHGWMAKTMETEFPGSKHLFGGEVRYKTNYVQDDQSLANLVYLVKLTPGYNGVSYTRIQPVSGADTGRYLNYSNAGTWSVLNVGSGSNFGSPTSGSWTNTPATVYEYRVAARYNVTSSGPGTPYPSSAPTAWSTIGGTGNVICQVSSGSTVAGSEDCSATFDIEVRRVGQSSPVMSSTITLGGTTDTGG